MSFRSLRSTWLLVFLSVSAAAIWGTRHSRAQSPAPSASLPGGLADGTTLLPNGWRIQPAGKHVRVGDMPLNLVQTPDSKYLIVTSNGLARPSFSIVDVASWTLKSTMQLDNAWYGLAWHPDGARLYSSGAGQNNVQEFNYANGAITRARTFTLPAVAGQSFAGGLTRHTRRLDALRDAGVCADGVGDRPGIGTGDEDHFAAGRAVRQRRSRLTGRGSTSRSGAARRYRSTCCRR